MLQEAKELEKVDSSVVEIHCYTGVAVLFWSVHHEVRIHERSSVVEARIRLRHGDWNPTRQRFLENSYRSIRFNVIQQNFNRTQLTMPRTDISSACMTGVVFAKSTETPWCLIAFAIFCLFQVFACLRLAACRSIGQTLWTCQRTQPGS